MMRKDEDVKDRIPMNADDETIFNVFDNGILLCKLIMQVDEECIDVRAINRKEGLNKYEIMENLKMGIAAAAAQGVRMIGIVPKSFIEKT